MGRNKSIIYQGLVKSADTETHGRIRRVGWYGSLGNSIELNKSKLDKMKTQLIHKLKQRGYKQNLMMKQMEGILHEDRAKTLTRKFKPKDTHNQILVTNYSNDIPRITKSYETGR